MSNFLNGRRKMLGLGDGPSDQPITIYDANGNIVPMAIYGSGDSQYSAYPPDIFVNLDRGDSTETYLAPGFTSNAIPTVDPIVVTHSPLEIVSQFDSGPLPQQSAPVISPSQPADSKPLISIPESIQNPPPVYTYQAPPGTVYGPQLPADYTPQPQPTAGAITPAPIQVVPSYDFYAGGNSSGSGNSPATDTAETPDRSKLILAALAALALFN